MRLLEACTLLYMAYVFSPLDVSNGTLLESSIMAYDVH